MALSKIGSGLGKFSFGLAAAMDFRGTINYYNDPTSPNSANPGKATVNTVFGALGVWGGVAGESEAYFILELMHFILAAGMEQ
ncbi:hypothetical protein [Chryseobacterium indologenes]|uniref:Uncharacterized protein n=1 Tax=Chryseobacterium indologenes TaxID=253 RepID=A0A0N1KR94_CHRID|nr:hypothetical protein [Chryseobacterium indologenes]KPE48950.1 hypothetical protein AOB46_22640 [Chryseobacterium indologenes]